MQSGSGGATTTTTRRRWWSVLTLVLQAALFVLSLSFLHTTAGVGGTAVGVIVTCAVTWYYVRRRHHPWQRQLHTAARTMTAVTLVWTLVSFGHYVLQQNGDTFGDKTTSWARNHQLGFVVNRLEQVAYSTPPSKAPAKRLVLDLPVESTLPADSTPAGTDVSTTVPEMQPPAALTTYFPNPLPDEGKWQPVASAGGHVAMWATSLRPLPQVGGVVASMVVIDQTHLRAAMFNGDELPGGRWTRGNKVPSDLWPAMMAVMNGGFRLDQTYGGYMTEGKVVQKLIDNRATLAIDKQGHIKVGAYGRDMTNDGTWETLRQNLVLIVDHGQPGIAYAKQQRVYWGGELDGTIFVNRSAACEMKNGAFAYVMAGKVSAEQFAQVLINVGCDTAMQLDVNGAWPTFLLYGHGLDGSLIPNRLDSRMNISPTRYTNGSTKEFFAFFDAALVPTHSVLDA